MTVSSAPVTAAMIRDARPRDFDEIVALEQTAWPQETGSHLLCDPWFAWDQFRLVEVDGRIVSMLKIYLRSIVWQDSTVKIGGIGDVVTHPAHRGRGYAAMAIRDAIRHMRDNGCELAILFSGLTEFYRQYGWNMLSQPSIQANLDGPLPPAAAAYELREFNIGDHLADVARIYAENNRERCGTVVRSPEYFRAQHGYKGQHPHRFTVAIRNARVVAYTWGRFTPGHCAIEEFGYAPDHDAALKELLHTSMISAHDAHCRNLDIPAPHGSIIPELLRKLEVPWRSQSFDNMMIRVINADTSSMKTFASELQCDLHRTEAVGRLFYWPSDRF